MPLQLSTLSRHRSRPGCKETNPPRKQLQHHWSPSLFFHQRKVKLLNRQSNTQGAPIRHIGGFLDEVGSDDGTLNAGWWLLPWHSDGAVAFHSAGARNSTVEWCSDLWFPPLWCNREDICDSRYGSLYQGHEMAFCGREFRNSDHYDQKMEFIEQMGQ